MDGSHPKEKYEFGVTDPTPEEKSGQRAPDPTLKRNLVKEPGSHPEENLGWENRKAKDTEVGQQTAPPPPYNNNNNNNSPSSKT